MPPHVAMARERAAGAVAVESRARPIAAELAGAAG
jgi:hypothetical protein